MAGTLRKYLRAGTALFRIAETNAQVMVKAMELAQGHRLQIWDAVTCAASLHAGSTHLLSKDMQEGALLNGVRVLNPFNPAIASVFGRLAAAGVQLALRVSCKDGAAADGQLGLPPLGWL